jgi:hypothetical protein
VDFYNLYDSWQAGFVKKTMAQTVTYTLTEDNGPVYIKLS